MTTPIYSADVHVQVFVNRALNEFVFLVTRWPPRVELIQTSGACTPTTPTGRPWSIVSSEILIFSTTKKYSDSAYSAGTCNLDMASGAIHPTTGQLPNDANCKIVTITIFKNVRLIEMLQANTATSWLWTTPGCRSTTMETREPLPSAALISPSAETLWCLAQWHSLIVDILNVSVLCHEDLTWKK